MSEARNPGIRSPKVRQLLARELPGLPPEIADGEDTYMMVIVATIWLDTDDRLAAERLEAERQIGGVADVV